MKFNHSLTPKSNTLKEEEDIIEDEDQLNDSRKALLLEEEKDSGSKIIDTKKDPSNI